MEPTTILQIKCNEINVRGRNAQQVLRINYSSGPTSAHYLFVTDDGVRLSIAYMDKFDRMVKLVAMPYDAISEYTCDEVHTPPVSA